MKIDYWHKFEEGCYYHLYNHAVNDKDIFNSKKDYNDFLLKHNKYLSCAFETLAYCLMPDHFHFVVKVKCNAEILENAIEEKSIASTSLQNGESNLNSFILDQYRRFFSSYSLSYNFRNNKRGQLFLKKFKRVSLDADTRLLYMICYVHHNPIHHRFTKVYNTWKYSSYNKYIHSTADDNYNKLMTNLFEGKKNFQHIHEDFKLNQEEYLNID